MTGRGLTWLLGLLLGLMLLPSRSALSDDAAKPGPLELMVPAALQAATPWPTTWLPAHQEQEGHWSGRGHDLSVTGLALHSILASGYTGNSEGGRHPLARAVRHGLGWLERRQRPDGCLARPADPDPQVGHAIGTLALTQAYSRAWDPARRSACVRSLAYLLRGQRDDGAWTLRGSKRVDTLATIWAGLALKAASDINAHAKTRDVKAPIPLDVAGAFARTLSWLDSRPEADSAVLTAASALLRLRAGQDPTKHVRLRKALAYLEAHPPTADPRTKAPPGLYTYLGAEAAGRQRGPVWRVWSQALRTSVVETQVKAGTYRERKGSWPAHGVFAVARGRVAMTALMVLATGRYYAYEAAYGDLIATQGSMSRDAEGLAVPAPGAMAAPTASPTTWKRSSLPAHNARMKLARGGTLPIDATHLRAEVHGTRAQVVLDLFVTNTEKDLKEGVLDLRLPDGAAPYYLAFGHAKLSLVPIPGAAASLGTDLASLQSASSGEWGAMLEARMAPVAQATNAFQTIVNTRRDPALLTWAGAGVFHLRVFPLEPGKQHRVTVAYEVDLTPVGEDAELTLALPHEVHDLRVAIKAPGATWSTTPEVTPEDGVRRWHEPATEEIRVRIAKPGTTLLVGPGAEERPHTALWVRPEFPALPRTTNSRAQFLIDISASVDADRMHVWRTLVPAILDANRDRLTSFSVGFFDMGTTWWRAGFVPNTAENVDALRAAIDASEPGGATDVAQALRAAREGSEPADIFLFTDADATWGEPTLRPILDEIRKGRPVFAYAVGMGERRERLQAIADRSGGALISVLGLADVAAAARAHRHQPWTLQALALPGVSDLLLAGDPREIYPGQRLRLAGRGRPEQGAQLFLRLRHGDREITRRETLPAPITSPMAARAYGYAGVLRLEAAGSTMRALATDYATHFRVVRKTCALVMLESEKDYQRFGLTQTGHGTRVAAHPVLNALGNQVPPAQEPTGTALVRFAARHKVPESLLAILRTPPPGLTPPASAPIAAPIDAELRALGTPLEGPQPTAWQTWSVALHAYGLKRPQFAIAPLLAAVGQGVDSHWLLARAAVAAKRPLLALAAYEAALAPAHTSLHNEIVWIIGADYERHLGHLLATNLPPRVARFAKARAASLAVWRRQLHADAPPKQADLVILHLPYDRRDGVTVEVRGPQGVLTDASLTGTRSLGATASRLSTYPANSPRMALQMQALRWPPGEPWRIRLVREEAQGEAHHDRSLVIVIRDWGRPAERVASIRSLGPDDTVRLAQSTEKNVPARKPAAHDLVARDFLRALAAKDTAAATAIANRDSAMEDPWRIADALLALDEHAAAQALAAAATRPELARLAEYVAARIAAPRSKASREAYEAKLHARALLPYEEGLALLQTLDVTPDDVPSTITLFWIGNTYFLSKRLDKAVEVCRRAGEKAERFGWSRMAASMFGLAGIAAAELDDEGITLDLLARQMENELYGSSERAMNASSRIRPILNRLLMQAITGQGATKRDGATYLGKLPVGALVAELKRCSPNATTTWLLALAFQMRGETDRALALLEKVRDRADFFHAPSDQAVLSYTLGEVYLASGRPSLGLDTLEKTITMTRKAKMFVIATLATTVASLCAASLGEYERSLNLAHAGLALIEKHGARVAAPVLYTAMARCETNRGNYHAALRHLEEARRLHTTFGATTDAVATLMEVGSVHVSLGDLDAAYEAFRAVRDQSETLRDVRGVLSGLANMGVVELERGRLAEAEAAFREVIKRAREAKRPKSLAVGLTNLADVQRIQGRLDDASATQDEAMRVAREEDLTRLLGDLHVDRALTELARGNHEAARTHAAAALELAASMAAPPLRLRADAARTLIEHDAGKHTQALAAAHAVADTLANITGRVAATPGARARSRFAAALEAGALSAVALDDADELAFFLETGRASLAREALGGHRSIADARTLPGLRRREQVARGSVLRATEAQLLARRRRNRVRLRGASKQLEVARQRLRVVMERIEGEHRQTSDLLYARVASLNDIQAELGPKQVCVLYGLFEAKAVALHITRAEALIVDLGPVAPIRETLRALRTAARDSALVGDAGTRARKLLWAPLALKDVDELLVSPDGELCATPPALLFPEGVNVVYLPSATWHTHRLDRAAKRGSKTLALGDPIYDGRLPQLDASRAEAKAAGDVVLLGADATESRLRAALKTKTRWRAVHLACHGIIDEQRPGLSHLALSADEDGDHELLALDVHRMNVPADLVVLSACNSGLGRYVRGTGMLGLTRAFLSAGSSQVLCSLWPVDDEATAALMQSFYSHWRGGEAMTAPAALRLAQAHVRSRDAKTVGRLRGPGKHTSTEKLPWSHPTYWAGWVVWGAP